MSINQIARRNEAATVDLLLHNRRGRFTYIEDKLFHDHGMFRLNERLNELKEKLTQLSTSKQLFQEDWQAYNGYIRELNRKIESRLEYLQSILNLYSSEKDSVYASLEGQIGKAKRKVSYVKSLTGSFSWISSERFINFMMLNTNIEGMMSINTNSEECTLPIKNRDAVRIKEIIIDNGSECIVGTPEGSNNKTTNLLSEREEVGFSVYSTNNNRCKLVLDVELGKEKVVNFLSIRKNRNASSFLKKINDIILYTKAGRSVSVKKLCKSDLKFKETQDTLELSFLPVKAISLNIIIEQTESYYIDGVEIKQIDLDSINLYAVRYSESGKLQSRDLNFGDYTAITTEVVRFPEEENYSLEMFIKKEADSLPLSLTDEPTLLNESLSILKWELLANRDVNQKIIPLDTKDFYEHKTLIRPFNPEFTERFELETKEEYYKPKIKAAHAITGKMRGDVVDGVLFKLGLNDIETVVPIQLNLEGAEPSTISINNLEIAVNHLFSSVKIGSASCKPIVSSINNYYYFELGEVFELGSIKYKYNDVTYSNLSIWESEGKIKGFAIPKDRLSFQAKDYLLEENRNLNNSYSFGTPIVQGTFLFKDNLGEGLEEKTYINGVEEFSSLSDYVTEELNSQNVTQGTVIMFEPEETVSSDQPAYFYKGSTLISNISFSDSVIVSNLTTDSPVIDTNTNVLYLKTSEESFFSDYNIRYKYQSQTASASKYFSINYLSGDLYFSHPVDESKKVRFETQTNNAEAEFTLAKYYDVAIDNESIIIYNQDAYKKLKLNRIHIYLPVVGESVNLSDLEEYYSPVLYSVELKAT